jgi:arylsulfatase
VGWELFGRCALRKGHWKLSKIELPFGKSRFELFNLSEDPGETVDLSGEYPEKYRELLEEWERYVEENGVILQE